MTDFPRSLMEFQQRFADEAACVAYLVQERWPQGFCCISHILSLDGRSARAAAMTPSVRKPA